MVIRHLKQTVKVEKLDKWVPRELTTNQKDPHFEVSSSLILCNNNEPFLNQIVMHDDKWILYDNWQWPTQWLDREEAPKHFPKPDLHPGMSWSLFRGLLLVWSTTVFWIPVKPLHQRSAQQIDEMHWTTTPAATIVKQNGPNYPQQCPIASHTTNASKVEIIGLWSFALSAIFTWPLTNYCFFKHLNHFLQGKDFHNQLEAENASQEFFESWSMDFYAKQTYFSLAKMCLL